MPQSPTPALQFFAFRSLIFTPASVNVYSAPFREAQSPHQRATCELSRNSCMRFWFYRSFYSHFHKIHLSWRVCLVLCIVFTPICRWVVRRTSKIRGPITISNAFSHQSWALTRHCGITMRSWSTQTSLIGWLWSFQLCLPSITPKTEQIRPLPP